MLERKSTARGWRLRVRCWGDNPVTQFPDPAPGAKETAWGQGAGLAAEPKRPELSSIHNRRNQLHFFITAIHDWKWGKKVLFVAAVKSIRMLGINLIKYV